MPSERARLVRRHRDRVLRLPNVVGCGWGHKQVGSKRTGREGLVVFVRKKVPLAQLKAAHVVPEQLDGVPTDVIEIGEVKMLGAAGPTLTTGSRRGDGGTRPDCPEDVDRMACIRPAPAGVSIGHLSVTAGTFGAVVYDRATGEPFILSNNHVVANQSDGSDERAEIGDPILQPGPYDGGTIEHDLIGHLARFVPVRPLFVLPPCSIARTVETVLNTALRIIHPAYQARLLRRSDHDNLVDAALVKPVNGRSIESCIVGLGRVRGVTEAEIGMKVSKSGRSSGVTGGEVTALDATLNVGLGDGAIARFANQIVTSPMAQPGDSGSLVVDERLRAVGLLFAGSEQATLCNPIQAVCDALDVRF